MNTNTKLFILLLFLLLLLLVRKHKVDKFTSKCLGKRDGVSGCRDCCAQFSNKKYKKCVSDCMNF